MSETRPDESLTDHVSTKTLSVLLLPLFPIRDASSRYRIYSYIPYLQKRGLRVRVIPSVSDRIFDFFYGAILHGKLPLPALIMTKFIKLVVYSLMIVNRLFVILCIAPQYDVIVLHRMLFSGRMGLLERLLHWVNPRIIYDFDDALDQMRSYRHSFAKVISSVAAVLAGNEILAEATRRYCSDVTILPTAIDIERYLPKQHNERGQNQPVVIGWIGNPSGLHYVEHISSAIVEVLRKRQNASLTLISDGSRIAVPHDVSARIHAVHWQLDCEIEHLQSFDIGIMPLLDDSFSRGKCGFKLIQYMGVGLPVVSSPVGVNSQILQDGINGFLAANDEEWVSSLIHLIDDSGERKRLGEKGRQLVSVSYSIERQVDSMIAVIERVARQAHNRHT